MFKIIAILYNVMVCAFAYHGNLNTLDVSSPVALHAPLPIRNIDPTKYSYAITYDKVLNTLNSPHAVNVPVSAAAAPLKSSYGFRIDRFVNNFPASIAATAPILSSASELVAPNPSITFSSPQVPIPRPISENAALIMNSQTTMSQLNAPVATQLNSPSAMEKFPANNPQARPISFGLNSPFKFPVPFQFALQFANHAPNQEKTPTTLQSSSQMKLPTANKHQHLNQMMVSNNLLMPQNIQYTVPGQTSQLEPTKLSINSPIAAADSTQPNQMSQQNEPIPEQSQQTTRFQYYPQMNYYLSQLSAPTFW